MQIAGCFRVVNHKDRVISQRHPPTLSARGASLDVRLISLNEGRTPLLLVSASRKTGAAVTRNQFRRRVRMAFLAVLRETPALLDAKFVLWVRPARGNSSGCQIEYQDIEMQIKSSLSSLRRT